MTNLILTNGKSGAETRSAIRQVSILGGKGRDGLPDAVGRLDLNMGDVVSIVGPTGSGKTTLINDIELFADGDTPTGRRILINGERRRRNYRDDPRAIRSR